MLNINAIPKPFDNLRPKSFFASRKNQIIERLVTRSSYKSFNKNFALKGLTTSRLPIDHDAAWEELKIMTPWVLFLGMVIIYFLKVFEWI